MKQVRGYGWNVGLCLYTFWTYDLIWIEKIVNGLLLSVNEPQLYPNMQDYWFLGCRSFPIRHATGSINFIAIIISNAKTGFFSSGIKNSEIISFDMFSKFDNLSTSFIVDFFNQLHNSKSSFKICFFNCFHY